MKLVNFRSCVRSVCTALVLCVALLVFTGCRMEAPGETTSEVSRRHHRVIDVNLRHQLQEDLDAYFMLDKPSKLSRRIVR